MALALPITDAANPPDVKEGLWSVHTQSIDHPGNKTLATIQLSGHAGPGWSNRGVALVDPGFSFSRSLKVPAQTASCENHPIPGGLPHRQKKAPNTPKLY